MEPVAVLVMGVAGCGKTTLAGLVASSLPFVMIDADDFHSIASVRRMQRGVPLDDRARQPWLRRLRRAIDDQVAEGHRVVVACSALKAAYREILLGAIPSAAVVYLKADRDTLERRLRTRRGHFMPAELLDSQLADLEEPDDAIVLDARLEPAKLLDRLRSVIDATA